MKTLPRLLPLIAVALLLVSGVAQAAVVADLPETDVEYAFGDTLTLTLDISDGSIPTAANLTVRTAGSSTAATVPVDITQTRDGFILRGVFDLSTYMLRPFQQAEYAWQVSFADGSTASATSRFLYQDNRFSWQADDSLPGVRVFWHAGNSEFGRLAADVSYNAIRQISSDLNVPRTPDSRVDVYIYSDVTDLRAALGAGGLDWVGGHADPAAGVVLVAVPEMDAARARIEFGRVLPHEITHFMLYQRLGERYERVPTWLNEGLASRYEERRNVVYLQALDQAASTQTLLAFDELCNGFPTSAERGLLAYAQSESLVLYIIERWGIGSINDLLDAYNDGASCTAGVSNTLGLSLTALQSAWERDQLNPDLFTRYIKPLLPWLLVLAVVTVLVMPVFFGIRMQRRADGDPAARTPAARETHAER